MVSTPKVQALRDEIAGHHRIVIAASFKGSIERCVLVAREMGFDTCVIDGDGWLAYDVQGEMFKVGQGKSKTPLHPLKHWKNSPRPVALIGNPASCRFGITLIEAIKMVFFDNSFSAEHRLQMIDRIHRIGTTVSPEIVDLIHLPVDQLVVDTLDSNRELELLSLGAISESLGEGEIEDIPLT
jgi:SNF2 family DNA or RNA helicase